MSTNIQSSDLSLRDDPDMTSDKFIERYCEVFREHAYATRDDSFNEFEKLITVVLDNKIRYGRIFKILGLDDACLMHLENLLNAESTAEPEDDEFASDLREKTRLLVRGVEKALEESEEYRMLEEYEIESMARAVVMYHLVARR